MKILSIGNFTTGWDGSICDEEHIAAALEGFDHEVDRQQREEIADGWFTGSEITEAYDFILIAQYDRYPEDLVEALRHFWSCPIAYWAFDHQADGQEWHERLIRESNIYLSKPLSDMKKHQNWRWLSQDFAPMFLDKEKDVFHKDIDVLFTGSWVPWASGQARVDILRAIDKDFNLQINSVTPDQWKSEGFKNVQGPVMDKELPALIARAKVNFSMDHVWAPGYWSDRNAQIMACGGFVLFRHVPLSETVFRDNIGYFWDEKSCLKSLKYWLDNDEDREGLAKFGYEYAQAHLMVRNRVDDLVTVMREFV